MNSDQTGHTASGGSTPGGAPRSGARGILASMLEVGTAMVRLQEQVFTSLFRTTPAGAKDEAVPGRHTEDPGSESHDQGTDPDDAVSAAPDTASVTEDPASAVKDPAAPDSAESNSDAGDPIEGELTRLIAARAEQISHSRPASDQVENWLQAEQEVQAERHLIAARAREIAVSPGARGELDNWLQAERELADAGGVAGLRDGTPMG